jgi:hypothetical protein
VLDSLFSLLRYLLVTYPYQVQPDSYQDKEHYNIVHEHIDSVIDSLEQQDDEQVVERDGNRCTCNPNTCIVLYGERLPLPEPPLGSRYRDRGEVGSSP